MIQAVNDQPYATILIDDMEHRLPIQIGSEGPKAIDVQALYKTAGYFTFDPAFMSTASCKSSITYINGEGNKEGSEGILRHRGYSIKDLAKNGDFLEVAFLILDGELPTAPQRRKFIRTLQDHMDIPDRLENIFDAFPRKAHPMSMLASTVAALSAYYHGKIDIHDPEERLKVSYQIIAKMPVIAAMCYRHSINAEFIPPRDDLDYVENFLYMCFSEKEDQKYQPNPVVARAIDLLLLLHADHEQNASASTIRVCGSSGTDPFAAVSAAISSLWGPAHGGANEAVIKMLMEIGTEANIHKFIAKAKDKSDPFRLMGFGHRVYKNYDPRASIIKQACHDVLIAVGKENDPLMRIAMKLEKIALKDPYFIERKLYPNVDFYSGIIYQAVGIPPDMFTVMFALGRTVGWMAQWMEMMGDSDTKIARPRQVYTGPEERPYLHVNNRA